MSSGRFPWRCRVVGERVAARAGRGGWRSVRPELPPATADRVSRLEPAARAAALAVHEAIDGAARTMGRRAEDLVVFLWVTMPQGCEAADRAYWETAHGDGALASPQRFVATLPSAVAGDVALALGLRGPAIVTAGSAGPRGGVSPAAIDAAEGAADLLVCLTVTGARTGRSAPRALAVALPCGSRAAPERGGDTLRQVRPAVGRERGGRARGG